MIAFAAALGLGSTLTGFAAQSAPAAARPDLSGLWDGGGSNVVEHVRSQGGEVPFTDYGAERYRTVDLSENPNGYCLPPGPSRAITGPSPFLIVQSDDVIALLHENHGVYRPIYMDGRGHPEDILDYPQFMGHSIGRWEGNVLVVDTIGVNERTWLDSNGLEHSIQLRLTERFEKTGPDVIRYSVTYEDPVFFARPFTATFDLTRQEGRIIEYVCNENERDLRMLQGLQPRLNP